MMTIEAVTPQKAQVLKDIRLRALQDTPSAFGSTYARESLFTDEKWVERATPQIGVNITYLAMDNDLACGLVGGFLNREDGARVTLVSMWVAPTHRRKGVGQHLIQAVSDWAKSHGVSVLFLLVTSNNDVAIKFYERMGFEKTGHTVPYPNDLSLFEYEMKKIIS